MINTSSNFYTNQTTFGTTKKQFKKMFKVCSYSDEKFENGDTITIEHIIPQSRGGDIHDKTNQIGVKRSWNMKRSSLMLKFFEEDCPNLAENIRKTVKAMEGVIVDGKNWAEEVKPKFIEEFGRNIFKK